MISGEILRGEGMASCEHRRGHDTVTGRRAVPEILIVEDDADFLDDLLGAWHPPRAVAVAHSGREAYDYFQIRIPEAVFLDLNLPHHLAASDSSEGCAILSYIRSCVSGELPVIIVSRDGSDDTRRSIETLGANEFIEKPVSLDDLDRALSRWLS